MNLAPLLLGGLLVAGVVVAGDDHLTALMKKLHGSEPDCPLAGDSEIAPLGALHEAVGRLGLDEARRAALHERLREHAPAMHEALAAAVTARDAQVRATFMVPFDAPALEQASQALDAAR